MLVLYLENCGVVVVVVEVGLLQVGVMVKGALTFAPALATALALAHAGCVFYG